MQPSLTAGLCLPRPRRLFRGPASEKKLVNPQTRKVMKKEDHFMYVFMYVSLHACMHACMHVCMYACMHACTYVCMYVCMLVCLYACIDTETCVSRPVCLNHGLGYMTSYDFIPEVWIAVPCKSYFNMLYERTRFSHINGQISHHRNVTRILLISHQWGTTSNWSSVESSDISKKHFSKILE